MIPFERIDGVDRTPHGVVARLHGEQLRIDVVRHDVVRFAVSRGGRFDETPTFAVCVDPLARVAEFTVEEGPDEIVLRTSALVVTLGRDPFLLVVRRPDGSPVIESARAADGRPGTFATLNDAFQVRRRRHPDDAFYGLGEKTGPHQRGGRAYTLWNTDVLDPRASGEFTRSAGAEGPRADNTSTEFDPYYVSIPFFYHQHRPGGPMSASFVDNGHRATYDFSAPDEYRYSFSGGQYTEYVFAGPDMPGILGAYTWLTGRMALPPLWALGYHQCRWYAYDQAALEALGRRHRDLGIPCDALWLDIDYMDGYRVFTWDSEKFPDPRGMLDALAADGFRVITIIDPGVKFDPGYAVFDQAVERDVLCRTEGGGLYLGQVWPGLTAFPDFVTEQARAWWGRLNAEHVRSGLAGIWNDMNEPATGEIPPEPMRFDRGRSSHERYHNQYALLMAMGTVAGLDEAMPDLRTFVLSRAGFAGIQRYAANWLGDNQARWDHLALSIPMANGMGVSGQPFVGADIGGFMGDSNGELLVRWAQMGALTPFCRNHSATGSIDQYAWSFGAEVEDLVREAIRLRYRLMPYVYSAFVEATESGAPVQRPLVFDHQDDPVAAAVEDQFLLGRDLLVAPVTGPGVLERDVTLPVGEWVEWHTGARVAGGRTVLCAAPLDRIPLFVRAGAVIPMWPEAPQSTSGYHPRVLELHVFVPSADTALTTRVQEDDGLTRAALEGRRLRTTLRLERAGGRVRLQAEVEGKGYPQFAREAFDVVLHGASPSWAALDGATVTMVDDRLTIAESGRGFVLDLAL